MKRQSAYCPVPACRRTKAGRGANVASARGTRTAPRTGVGGAFVVLKRTINSTAHGNWPVVREVLRVLRQDMAVAQETAIV